MSDGDANQPHGDPIRVVVQQPCLPKYRLPVFQELAGRPGIRLTLLYGDHPLGPASVEPQGLDAQFVPIRRVGAAGQWLLWHSAQWSPARRPRADVLILSWDLHYASLVPSLLRARRNGVATILWGHGFSKHEAAVRKTLRDGVARLATALLFYDRTTAAGFRAGGWDPQRVFVAANALDDRPIRAARTRWTDTPDRLHEFKTRHGLLPGPVILFVSRLLPENRVDLLLQAAPALAARHPGMRVVLIGQGPEESRLRAMAADLGIADRVRFEGAIYDEDQLAPWFLSATLFCYPANIGLSLVHAFAYGLPVVTSARREAQNPEIDALKPGENGLVYDDGDIASLQAALDNLCTDTGLRARLARGASETVERSFNLRTMVDGMEAAVRYCATVRDPTPDARQSEGA